MAIAPAPQSYPTQKRDIFDHLLADAIQKGRYNIRSAEAVKWFYHHASRVSEPPAQIIHEAKHQRQSRHATIGRMYHFIYDPKHKDKLPFWDRHPLVFPFRLLPNGFVGLNLHYLPPRLRARLMDQLHTIANNQKYDLTTKLRLSWKVLQANQRLKWMQPCVHMYLYDHLRSPLIEVYSSEWDLALMLPCRFVGATNRTVHRRAIDMFT